MVFASAGAMEAFEAWVAETSKAVQAQAKGTRPASRRWARRPRRRRWRCRLGSLEPRDGEPLNWRRRHRQAFSPAGRKQGEGAERRFVPLPSRARAGRWFRSVDASAAHGVTEFRCGSRRWLNPVNDLFLAHRRQLSPFRYTE